MKELPTAAGDHGLTFELGINTSVIDHLGIYPMNSIWKSTAANKNRNPDALQRTHEHLRALSLSQSPLSFYGPVCLGPREGYNRHLGFLASQLDCVVVWTRLHGLTQEELNWLPGPDRTRERSCSI